MTVSMTQKFSLKKHERLKSKILLDKLFQSGQSNFTYPIKLIYQIDPLPEEAWPLLFSVTVPKKKIKSAVDRNLIKRRIREAYRLHKLDLQEKLVEAGTHRMAIMLIYIESDTKEYKVIEKSVLKLLKKLSDVIPN